MKFLEAISILIYIKVINISFEKSDNRVRLKMEKWLNFLFN
jgi:hypothetical protein